MYIKFSFDTNFGVRTNFLLCLLIVLYVIYTIINPDSFILKLYMHNILRGKNNNKRLVTEEIN
jgi:hypothetical protein